MKLDLSGLFQEELAELSTAERICLDEEKQDHELFPAYKRLTLMYAKSLKSMMKLTQIGDSQQSYLQKIHNQLETEIKERKLAETKLEYYAFTDEMTDISNRRTGLMILQKELKSALRTKKPLSICFIDIDGLKSVNDTYGHDEGDYLIKAVSRIIRSTIRDVDEVSRMGGDEFLIIFPDCPLNNAQEVMGRIQEIMKRDHESSKKPYRCSFSFGIVEARKDGEVTIDELIKQADQKMYEHKLTRKL